MSDSGLLLLVVEDEPQMRRFLRASLDVHGFRLLEAETGAAAIVLSASQHPDIVLLDLGLPDIDGITVTRRLRKRSRVPIIVLSARGRESDKVEALDAGADDYLTKPFGVNELLARIRVALRHTQPLKPGESEILESGSLKIDLARRLVTLAGRVVYLTPIEYRLLVLLAHHAGKVLTHRQILKEIWGPTYAEQTHYLRVYMGQLRRKIEADPARPRILVTEQGVGYRLYEEP